ncbi:hypothetical protein Mgra_00008588, partial [Meloidogyne graminicola]
MISNYILLFNLFICFGASLSNNYPKCRNYQQACAVELLKFPSLVAEDRDGFDEKQKDDEKVVQEGSGEDNDIEQIHFVPIRMSFPVYDEFVSTTPTYDYSMDPVEKIQHQVCSCLGEEKCGNFNNNEQILELSNQIRFEFCKPLDEIFKVKCKGMRTLARVIGRIDMESKLSRDYIGLYIYPEN